MKESHDEGPASHIDPESCVGSRKAAGEALTGAHAGQVLGCETASGTPTPLSDAEGKIGGGDKGEPSTSPAQSQTLSTRGNFLHGNREAPRTSATSADRSEKALGRAPDMHVFGESDDRVAPEQPANHSEVFWTLWERVSAATAHDEDEPTTAGGRRSTEGNTDPPAASRTQSRETCASSGLVRVREAANASTPSPKVRAVCGSAARTDLCGGPLARAVPTATGERCAWSAIGRIF
jgi:RNA-directed DNA polymerase